MAKDRVTLIHHATGRRIELPVLQGTRGAVIDIRALGAELGLFTYDPGFVSTASCRSAITYVDGDEGELLYRGYPVDQLARDSSYLEVCYLLQYGELPNLSQMEDYRARVRRNRTVDGVVRQVFSGFRRDAHPMAMLISAVGALAAAYHDSLDVNLPQDRDAAAHLLIGQLPTLAACCHRHGAGQSPAEPDDSLGHAENFLHMMFARPGRTYSVVPAMARALELVFILHADHEQNASTSTVRLAGSSGAMPFACISAGLASLWGPAHGGANEAVIRMLQTIRTVKDVPALIARAKDRNDPFRLVGFGHRVYRNYDPRARIIRQACHDLLADLRPHDDPLFAIALELERRALEDEYFQSRYLYPNVDFYSGIILRALGVPLKMFTAIFALARTAGWIAQWQEMMEDSDQRIGRPRQLYSGEARRDYVPLDRRGRPPRVVRGGIG